MASSVARLPRERIRDMTSERLAFEKTSGMAIGSPILVAPAMYSGRAEAAAQRQKLLS